MIKNKYYIYCSVLLFIICEALFFPYPNNHLFEARVTFMTFPIKDGNGYILSGIIGAIIFLLSLAMLLLGLKRLYTLAVVLFSGSFVIIPLLIISIIQQTFATGIYAISYDGTGECKIEELNHEQVKGECFITVINHSDQKVISRMELIDSFIQEEQAQFESLFNLAGPIHITLMPHEKKTIHLKKTISISNIPDRIGIGTAHNVHFKLIEGTNERVF